MADRTDLLPLPISESLEVGKFGQVSLRLWRPCDFSSRVATGAGDDDQERG